MEDLVDFFLPEKLPLGSSTLKNPDSLNSYNFAMNQGKNPEQGSSKEPTGVGGSTTKENPEQGPSKGSVGSVGAGGSTIKEEFDPIIVDILGDKIKEDTQETNKAILAWAGKLKNYRDLPFDQLMLTSESDEPLLTLLRHQSNIYTKYVKNRMTWVSSRSVNTLGENKIRVREIHYNLAEIQEKYLSKVDTISKLENTTIQLKEFYATLNEYRNLSLKELNKADKIILEDIRKSALSKHSELKKVINAEYTEAKKEYNSQDSYLRMKVGEILKAKKK